MLAVVQERGTLRSSKGVKRRSEERGEEKGKKYERVISIHKKTWGKEGDTRVDRNTVRILGVAAAWDKAPVFITGKEPWTGPSYSHGDNSRRLTT